MLATFPEPHVDPAHWASLAPSAQRDYFSQHMQLQSTYLQQQNMLQLHQLQQVQRGRMTDDEELSYNNKNNRGSMPQQQHSSTAQQMQHHVRSMSHSASVGMMPRPTQHSAPQRKPHGSMQTQQQQSRKLNPVRSAAALPVYRPATAAAPSAAASAAAPLSHLANGWTGI